jgi:hypothetical protein
MPDSGASPSISKSPTPDEAAAHQFLCELRTRIATQPVSYQHGVEARALESLWEVFGHAREAMKKYPRCNAFADLVTEMLNMDLRPLTVRKPALRALLLMAGMIIPLGAVALFDVLLYVGYQSWTGALLLAGLAVFFAFVAIGLLNVNLTGPHRLYRDQLASTFIQISEKDDRPLPLADINPRSGAPYHLINTALNVPSSTHPALRDRKCDFFLFSKYWCGSPVSRY